jgi:dihydroorotase-like cyclic amidohydrolase
VNEALPLLHLYAFSLARDFTSALNNMTKSMVLHKISKNVFEESILVQSFNTATREGCPVLTVVLSCRETVEEIVRATKQGCVASSVSHCLIIEIRSSGIRCRNRINSGIHDDDGGDF